jgi:uncharacterized caspase-like protein
LDNAATSENILGAIGSACREVSPGDIILFYFSGHGIQVRDMDGDEGDRLDECLVAWDRPILDDEFREAWSGLSPSVRLLTIVDACSSATPMSLPSPLGAPSPTPLASPRRSQRPQIQCRMVHLGACADDALSFGDPALGGAYFTLALRQAMDDASPPKSYDELVAEIRARVLQITQRPDLQQAQLSALPSRNQSFLGERPFQI